MTLEQLRIFIAVAERQHVTRAADALNLAQSAVSASIATLEGQYCTKLFHRVGLGIALDRLPIAIELPGNEAVRAAVEAGAGAAALSASVVAGSLEAGLLHHVPFDLPARSFRLLRHRERHHSKAAEALMTLVGTPPG